MAKHITLQNIYAGYRDIEVLKNISIEFKHGNLYSIVGPNGAGKTTLLRVLAGILRPWKGAVYIDGKNLIVYDLNEKSKIVAYSSIEIPRGFSATAANLLETSLYPLKLNKHEILERITYISKLLEIEYLLNRRLDSLSSGELQRVLIASALIRKPRILLVDEPTAHLDMKYRIKVMEILRDYTKKESAITIIAIHDVSLATIYSDYIIFVKNGKIVASGIPKEVVSEDVIEKVYEVKCRVIELENLGPIVVILPR